MSNSVKDQQKTPNLVAGPMIPSIYVEGLTQISVGFPNSRLVLHSLVERTGEGSESQENRRIACELILPTASAIEIAQLLINQLASNKDMLRKTGRDWSEKIDTLFESLERVEVMKPVATDKKGPK